MNIQLQVHYTHWITCVVDWLIDTHTVWENFVHGVSAVKCHEAKVLHTTQSHHIIAVVYSLNTQNTDTCTVQLVWSQNTDMTSVNRLSASVIKQSSTYSFMYYIHLHWLLWPTKLTLDTGQRSSYFHSFIHYYINSDLFKHFALLNWTAASQTWIQNLVETALAYTVLTVICTNLPLGTKSITSYQTYK